jgi:rubrerythrin
MSDKPSIIGLLGPIIAPYPPEEQRLFAALGERVAAGRYRAWSESVDDESIRDILLTCAAREEDIAGRVESLHGSSAAIQQQMSKDHPDIERQYRDLFEGMPLPEQFALQAEAERAGAAAWRAFAAACSDPEEAETLLACAPLEEASASDLERIIDSMTRA